MSSVLQRSQRFWDVQTGSAIAVIRKSRREHTAGAVLWYAWGWKYYSVANICMARKDSSWFGILVDEIPRSYYRVQEKETLSRISYDKASGSRPRRKARSRSRRKAALIRSSQGSLVL